MNKHTAIVLGLNEIVEDSQAAETAAELLRQAADLEAKAAALETFDREFLAACARLEAAHAGVGIYARYCMKQTFDAGLEASVMREWAEEARKEADSPAPKDLKVHKRRVRY